MAAGRYGQQFEYRFNAGVLGNDGASGYRGKCT
jgi:hypothetical protein